MEPNRFSRGLVLSKSKGFTLVELLVVLAIIMIVTAIVITSQGTFNKTLVLSNTAYDIALAIRSAETYGLGSRAFGTSVNAGYGLHFQIGTAGFVLFSDFDPPIGSNPSVLCHAPPVNDPTGPNAKPGDCVYDPLTEKVIDYAFGNGITIKDFCVRDSLNNWSCTYAHNGASGGLSSIDIVFSRPNPEPFISTNNVYTGGTAACIAVTSQQGGEKYVSVVASGQITATAASCPLP